MRLLQLFERDERGETMKNPLPRVLSARHKKFGEWHDRYDAIFYNVRDRMFPHAATPSGDPNALFSRRDPEKVKRETRAVLKKIRQIVELPPGEIIGSEPRLSVWTVQTGKTKGRRTKYPTVIRIDGKFFAVDGNHRIARAYINEQPTIEVELIDVDALEQELAA